MLSHFQPPRGERGMAQVMALLALLTLSLLVMVLMLTINSETKVSGYGVRESQALNYAEAGVSEAISRLRNGDITLSTGNPKAVGQIFLTPAGSVPVLGTDSVAVETKQPAGQWLNYSTDSRGPNVLTVKWKTDSARTVIYKFDPAKAPPINAVSGIPIYVISSSGQNGTATRRVVTEVIQKPFNTLVHGALCAGTDINFAGNGVVCGFDHSIATPPPTGENGQSNNPSCIPYETGGNKLPGSWTTGNTLNYGAAYQTGWPVPTVSNQTGFYLGPWDALGITQVEFYSWVGPHVNSEPDPPNGIYYLDHDNQSQNRAGQFAFHGTSGEGFLYVDGDLSLNSTFTYKGLIYVEGDLTINGQAWVLGAIIVRGKSQLQANGGMTVLYSSEAVLVELAKYGSQFTTLSWREQQ